MKFTELSEAQWYKIYELMNWSPRLVRGTQRTDLKKNLEFDFLHPLPRLSLI